MALNLLEPIEKLAYVGPRNAPKLKKLGIKTFRDLVRYLPFRYEDRSQVAPIADALSRDGLVCVGGTISDISVSRTWRKRMTITTAWVKDQSGLLRAVWFNQPYLTNSLPVGTPVSLSGKLSKDRHGLYLSGPVYEKIYNFHDPRTSAKRLIHTGRLVPIYPETRGVSSKYLRMLISRLLAGINRMPDPLPPHIATRHGFPPIADSLRKIHFPNNLSEAQIARNRFCFEEILKFQLRALLDHRRLRNFSSPKIKFDKHLAAEFVGLLPFELTGDQKRAAYETLNDLDRGFPMNRLLNGDVGSGKTVVALIAAFQTAAAGYQTVFMVPTEILARQHFFTVTEVLSGKSRPLNSSPGEDRETKPIKRDIKIGLLTGSEARQFSFDETGEEKITKKAMQQKIASGEINIAIGTHAVIQKNVKFKNLGFVVVDEQHRFGVEQRMKLAKNCGSKIGTSNLVPHFLSMTATPIPRTLALTIFGDLDLSILKEKPKNRLEIKTYIVPDSKRKDAYGFIDKEIQSGRQVFVICPRIEISDPNASSQLPAYNLQLNEFGLKAESRKLKAAMVWAEVKAVTEEFEKLSKNIFPHRRVAMLHGKMKSREKEKIMRDFKNGECDILVSTSVVEVGVDVPNATIMIVESADRFGLAQLHQFRGRVGRASYQSFCFLFATSGSDPANRRLRVLEKTSDGFELAEMDLRLRGPGEFGGVKQSGLPDFAMASLADVELIKKARLEAKLLLKEDPGLRKWPNLLQEVQGMQRLTHFE